MPQSANIRFNFSQGLDLKTDDKQIPTGKFLDLENIIFDKGGLLQKRNGFAQLSPPLDLTATYLTTFNNNLTAIGDSISAYSASNNQWVTKGTVQPLSLSTLPLIRNNTNQSQVDIAMADNGLICTVYTDQNPTNPSTLVYKYAIANSTTGQNIVAPTLIPANGGGTITGAPRVFVLANYFIILFTNDISGTFDLQYIAISSFNTSVVTAPAN